MWRVTAGEQDLDTQNQSLCVNVNTLLAHLGEPSVSTPAPKVVLAQCATVCQHFSNSSVSTLLAQTFRFRPSSVCVL